MPRFWFVLVWSVFAALISTAVEISDLGLMGKLVGWASIIIVWTFICFSPERGRVERAGMALLLAVATALYAGAIWTNGTETHWKLVGVGVVSLIWAGLVAMSSSVDWENPSYGPDHTPSDFFV